MGQGRGKYNEGGEMTASVDCGKLCTYNVIPRGTTQNYTERHAKRLQIKSKRILKLCSSNPQESRKKKTETAIRQTEKNPRKLITE